MANRLWHSERRRPQRARPRQTQDHKQQSRPIVTRSTRPGFGPLIFFVTAFALGIYFTFAAVQGDYGLFRRIEIAAEQEGLQKDLDRQNQEIARMENLTHRLSDDYLDLDLLDQQARSVLGMLRADEIVIR